MERHKNKQMRIGLKRRKQFGALCLVLCACSTEPSLTPTAAPAPTQTPSPTATMLPTPTTLPTPTLIVLQSPLQSPIATAVASAAPMHYTYKVIHSYPHDPEAWIEGLVYTDSALFESTGELGRSSVREVELTTGKVLRKRALDNAFYGEGLALIGDQLVQLTWQNKTGFVYDAKTFEPISVFQYDHEGWGLAYNGQELALSDGTATLRFLDPKKLTEVRRVQVNDGGKPVVMLNELEWVNGELFANIWQTDLIARIDPRTGVVTGWIDLSGLLTDKDRTNAQQAGRVIDVLNGIAYDSKNDRLFVTGKFWPKLFEIQLVQKE